MSFISSRLNNFDSSEFRDVFNRIQQLNNPINLSVGEPEENTTASVKRAAIRAIRANKTKYTPTNGIKDLRVAIANKLNIQNEVFVNEDSVTIVPGLTTGQLLIYMTILDIGDEILIMDPYYPPYRHLANSLGANVKLIPTLADFQPNLDLIRSAITSETKAIVINSPNNPSGAVYPEATLMKIAEIANDNNLLVISDEIYEHFNYDGNHFSIGSVCHNTLTLGGFSKEFAMTGWRLGYIAGPSEIIDAINEIQQYTVFASSTIAQYAALKALNKRLSIVKKYKNKRDVVRQALIEMGYEVSGMQGAYYSFFKAPNNMTDLDFIERLAQNNLILVPGRAFSAYESFVRLSYGTDMKTIKKGLEVLARVTAEINHNSLR